MGKRNMLFCAALAVGTYAPGPATAEEQSVEEYQRRFQEWSNTVVELKKQDHHEVVQKETEALRTLIGQGQAFVASERLDQIPPIQEQVQVMTKLAKTRIKRAKLEAEAAQAEESAESAKTSAQTAKAEADAVEARYRELEAMGL